MRALFAFLRRARIRRTAEAEGSAILIGFSWGTGPSMLDYPCTEDALAENRERRGRGHRGSAESDAAHLGSARWPPSSGSQVANDFHDAPSPGMVLTTVTRS